MTLDSPAQLLGRFHDVLVEEIRARRPEYLTDSFTVAEIYQHLVPYASHRDRLGVEMNGDYEDVLLRLLAGQGGFLNLESEPARDRLLTELESSNPDTSLYREFAAAYVRLVQDKVRTEDREAFGAEAVAVEGPSEPAVAEEGSAEGTAATPAEEEVSLPVPTAEAPESPTHEEPAQEAVVDEDAVSEPEAPASWGARPPAAVGVSASHVEEADPTPATPAASGHGEARAGDGTCAWCREELPDRDDLRFCPYCGTDATLVPCPGCGEALEPRWRFCIVCGSEVAGA
jgi:hypothetical protein